METKTEPAPVCITHCGHDPRWTVEGVCREPIGPYLDPNGECGHRCPVHQVATSASDGVTVDPERDFTPTPPRIWIGLEHGRVYSGPLKNTVEMP